MKYTVYILYSRTTGKFYRGQTRDILERFRRHNSGWEKSTKSGCPWVLIWHTEKSCRNEALLLEKKLKNLSFKRLVDFMLKYSGEVAGPDEMELLKQFRDSGLISDSEFKE